MYDPNKVYDFEAEGEPTERLKDTIWVLDGMGRLIEVEVCDDDSDN